LIGGALIGLLPLNGVLIIVSGLFAVATILAMCLPLYEERRPKTANPIIEYGNLIRHIKQRKDRLLSALFVNLIAIIGVTAALSLLLPALISHHYPDDPLILGIVTSMIALGTMIGSGMTMIAKRVEPYFGMYVGWLLYGVFILLIALEHNMVTLISVGAFLGLVGAPADIFMNVIIHKNVAANKMAKTFALFATIGYSGDMISVVTIGMVAGVLGLQATFILSGGIVIVAALVGLALTLSAQDLKS
jgi:MFS family permease